MGEATAIAWTDHTFNPWWGCERVSPGCDHCYAETFAKRTGHDVWGHKADHRFFGDKHWNEPLKWDRKAREAGRQERVFCASMADVFQNSEDLVVERSRLFNLIAETPNLTWQLLTKRPENVHRMAPPSWLRHGFPSNVWLGTTVEDQVRADLRIPRLLAIQEVRVRFLSCEPLLEAVDLSNYLGIEWMDALRMPEAPVSFRGEGGWGLEMFAAMVGEPPGIDWVICGGESGPGHRPFEADWARDLRDQCAAAEIPYFFKQHGGRTPTAGGDMLDGKILKSFPPTPYTSVTTPEGV